MLADFKLAFRTLGKSPGFAAVAIAALAIGIGANTAVFSVVDAVLLRSLPYDQPDRIAMIWADNPKVDVGFTELPSSPADYNDFRKIKDTFRHTTLLRSERFNLSSGTEPYRAGGAMVGHEFFEVFGVRPAIGRTFTDAEQEPGNNRVVILSHGLWNRMYGGDPGIVGRRIQVNEKPYLVVGVMPPAFNYPRAADLPSPYGFAPEAELWVPHALTKEELQERSSRSYPMIARLADGVTMQRANDVLRREATRIQRENPDWKDWGFHAVGFRESLVGRVETLILLVSVAVAFVLLIACANVANLFLARAAGRTREIAVRIALGAGRADIIRQVLAESLLLALAGATAGIALAYAGINTLISRAPQDIPRLAETTIDARVMVFTLGLSLVTALLFGLAPALQLARTGVNDSLREGARGTENAGRRRIRNLLTAAEVALAVMLLVSAGLLIRSFSRLYAVDPGFSARSVVAFDVALPEEKYDTREKRLAFYEQLLARLKSSPGVELAAAISNVPLSGTENLSPFVVEGAPDPGRGQEPFADERRISPDYFAAVSTPLIAGRTFTSQDRRDTPGVAMVNETLARSFFPEGAIGKRIRTSQYTDTKAPFLQIVGVVRDVKQSSLASGPRNQIYLPMAQRSNTAMSVVVRLAGAAPLASADALARSAVREIDPRQPIGEVLTMQHVVDTSVARQRFTTMLLGVFAATALLLAVIGLYGVMAYNVTQRTREIGVRMALGAAHTDILRGVMGQGMAWVALGAAAGLAGSLALGRMMTSLLFGVAPTDPATYLGVVGALALTAAVAIWVPARRASRVDPMVALRQD